jgi:hypothetical protein
MTMTTTTLPLAAVEAMLQEPIIQILFCKLAYRHQYLASIINPPDWVIAGLNCHDDADILPMCIHVFLMDWKPEAEK